MEGRVVKSGFTILQNIFAKVNGGGRVSLSQASNLEKLSLGEKVAQSVCKLSFSVKRITDSLMSHFDVSESS